MITIHQYLDQYKISEASEKLILGTIHPHDHKCFLLPFFYGNKLSLWRILNEAFPDELIDPLSLNEILNFLNRRKIAVSDTIRECKRQRNTAFDKDIIPTVLNFDLIPAIKKSSIKEILFTSGFQKNNAFKLFYVDILKQKITKNIKENRAVTLDSEFFGRRVKLSILYSPSGAANTGISKSKTFIANKEKYKGLNTPVKAFKIDYYKEIFSKF